MLDIRLIRQEPEMVKQALATRNEPACENTIDEVSDIDAKYRKVEAQAEELRAEIKKISKEVGGKAKDDGKSEAIKTLKAESQKLGQAESKLEAEAAELLKKRNQLLLELPNIPSPDCPIGKSDEQNPVLDCPVEPNPDDFAPHQKIPHVEFAEEMGILDMKRAVKLSGPMFGMFRGQGAQLANALIQFGLERNRDLYEEIRPPSLVKTETLTATGHLPKFAEDAYSLEDGNLWAIPTGEVPLTYLMADEILEVARLPQRMMAYTPCYRREAGSAGQQTRGMLRVHEFDKVEILAYTTPDQAAELHQEILDRAVGLVKDLGLIYRIVDICTGDLGNSSMRTFDVEIYASGENRWLECSSVSWFGDYQSRRANIRYRNLDTKKTEFIHTLNGSAVAVPRVWTALVEMNHQADGSIAIPEPLRKYMGGASQITGA